MADQLEAEDAYEVAEIVDERVLADGQRLYRIRWKGFGPADDTWEPPDNLLQGCDALLERYRTAGGADQTNSSMSDQVEEELAQKEEEEEEEEEETPKAQKSRRGRKGTGRRGGRGRGGGQPAQQRRSRRLAKQQQKKPAPSSAEEEDLQEEEEIKSPSNSRSKRSPNRKKSSIMRNVHEENAEENDDEHVETEKEALEEKIVVKEEEMLEKDDVVEKEDLDKNDTVEREKENEEFDLVLKEEGTANDTTPDPEKEQDVVNDDVSEEKVQNEHEREAGAEKQSDVNEELHVIAMDVEEEDDEEIKREEVEEKKEELPKKGEPNAIEQQRQEAGSESAEKRQSEEKTAIDEFKKAGCSSEQTSAAPQQSLAEDLNQDEKGLRDESAIALPLRISRFDLNQLMNRSLKMEEQPLILTVKQLVEAVLSGQVTTVRRALLPLRGGAASRRRIMPSLDLNELVGDESLLYKRCSIICDAAHQGCQIVELLAQAGADVNWMSGRLAGRTALHAAVLKNEHCYVKQLISHKALLNVADDKGLTPLALAAAQACSPSIVQLLIDAGADPLCCPPNLIGEKGGRGSEDKRGQRKCVELLQQHSQRLQDAWLGVVRKELLQGIVLKKLVSRLHCAPLCQPRPFEVSFVHEKYPLPNERYGYLLVLGLAKFGGTNYPSSQVSVRTWGPSPVEGVTQLAADEGPPEVLWPVVEDGRHVFALRPKVGENRLRVDVNQRLCWESQLKLLAQVLLVHARPRDQPAAPFAQPNRQHHHHNASLPARPSTPGTVYGLG